MQAVQYSAYSSDFSNLEIVHVPKPTPGENQVLVKIFVSAANQIDLYLFYGIMRNNKWKMQFPFTPGYDFSGVVEDVGSNVRDFERGDEVFGVNWGISRHDNPKDPSEPIGGCFSEYIVIDSAKLSRKPRRVPFGYAAAIGTAGTAAYQCVHDIGLVGAGSRVLILGGSTMVGLLSIQLAKLAGAWVATTCSTRSHDFVSQFGADLVIHYDTEKWYNHPEIQALDFILDMAGIPYTLEKLKEVDNMINVGAAFVTLVNPDVGSNPKAHPPFAVARFYCFQQSTKVQDRLMALLEEEKIRVPICDHFPFTRRGVTHLYETLQGRQAQGKLLLRLD